MDPLVVLTNTTHTGSILEATFTPHRGMNLISFKKDGHEILDQSTKPLFLERCAGLGALIGPHFHHREQGAIPIHFDTSLFPHIAKEFSRGSKEPFSHGIARYVPWKYDYSNTQIYATLDGNDKYKGFAIKDFEGMNFSMVFDIKLTQDGLILNLSIKSEKPSLVGLHYYYLKPKSSIVRAFTKDTYRDPTGWHSLPSSWYSKEKHLLEIPLLDEIDFGFVPSMQEFSPYHRITLVSPENILHIDYTSSNEEDTSWQLYHPKGSSFVCIEPLSSLTPRSPKLCESNLQVKINLFDK